MLEANRLQVESTLKNIVNKNNGITRHGTIRDMIGQQPKRLSTHRLTNAGPRNKIVINIKKLPWNFFKHTERQSQEQENGGFSKAKDVVAKTDNSEYCEPTNDSELNQKTSFFAGYRQKESMQPLVSTKCLTDPKANESNRTNPQAPLQLTFGKINSVQSFELFDHKKTEVNPGKQALLYENVCKDQKKDIKIKGSNENNVMVNPYGKQTANSIIQSNTIPLTWKDGSSKGTSQFLKHKISCGLKEKIILSQLENLQLNRMQRSKQYSRQSTAKKSYRETPSRQISNPNSSRCRNSVHFPPLARIY